MQFRNLMVCKDWLIKLRSFHWTRIVYYIIV